MTPWAEADDTDLLLLVRDGHTDAMAELWSRHYPATLTAARRISRQPQDAEEFASDAFSGMLYAISNDGGPSVSVRGYLLTAVRNQAANRARRASANDVLTDELTDFEDPDRAGHDPVAHHAELGLVRQAFATLPPRWQMVLWRTAVDHEKNTVIAADLGRSPNAVAALAKRARQGFRLAYLRAHESTHGVAAECAPYASRLVELLPEADTVATAEVREHVADCPRCARRLADLRIVDADLGGALLPALLTLGPTIAWVTGAHATHAVGGALWLRWWHGPDRTRTLTIAGTAAGVLVAGTCAAFALTSSGSTAPHQALTTAASQNVPAVGSGSGQGSSDQVPSSTQSSRASSSTSKKSATAVVASSSSAQATSSTASSVTTTTSSSQSVTTSSHSQVPSSTVPGTSTPPVTQTSTVTPTSTPPVTHTSSPPGKPTSTRTRKPKPKPTPTSTPTTPPPACWWLICWPGD
ncbi:RNA polymerase sigma factor [Flexivirga alba]|uniref:RNA polymerase sigma factor n=1 Tax=Flexivirga alba TaxID=702742 RepID=A0ABW2AGS5_9MICO